MRMNGRQWVSQTSQEQERGRIQKASFSTYVYFNLNLYFFFYITLLCTANEYS